MDEIEFMSKETFKTTVKDKCEAAALRYLKSQNKIKGKEMKYEELTMQNYLVGDSD